MDTRRRVPLVVVWSVVVSMILISLTTRAPAGQPSSAPWEPWHEPSTPHQGQAPPDPMVTLHVRALVPEKVKLSDPAQGTVRARVLTIDQERNQIRVQTDEGQRLMLFLPPESLGHLHIGAPCLLQVAHRATREAAQLPAPAEVFW